MPDFKMCHPQQMRCVVFLLYLFPVVIIAQDQLPAELTAAIKNAGFTNQGIGLYIQPVDSQQTLVSYQADTPLNPASVVKLVTTATALDMLGSGYRWSTEVTYNGRIRNDTLYGDLYFQGNGDPYMTPERFWRLLNRIAIFGIKNIEGNVYFDNSYFNPGLIDYSAFDEQPYRTYNVGPNAVLVGFQATEFHFSKTNNRVKITPFPDSPKLRIVNKVKLSNGSCRHWQKQLNLKTKKVKRELQVIFTGRYSRNCEKKTLYRRVSESQDHFQHYFLPLWQQIGGTINGEIKPKTVPAKTKPIVNEESISLSDAIRLINKFSNNVMTRQVLLTMGAKFAGPPGTTEKGIKAINAWLAEQKLDSGSLQFDNGSGLSRKTRLSAEFLGHLLHLVYQQAYMPEFISSLPVTGYDGTMANRFNNEPILGSAHLKTGLLDFVQTMAGYVTAATGKRYVLVLLHNHPKAHTQAATRLQNDIIRWVYRLP